MESLKIQILDASKILKTAERLHRRMQQRFPTRNIVEVANEVCEATKATTEVAAWLKKPLLWYRVIAGFLVMLMVAALIGVMPMLLGRQEEMTLSDALQTFEAGVNDLIFVGIAIYFLLRLERTIKRNKALKMLHRLRSLAHIIDMHQLTKDPDSVVSQSKNTEDSPTRDLEPYELKRYFDYCSEMLSILSKQAALLVQDFDDPVTLSAVNEIESLTSGLSRKIWQKIIVATRLPEFKEIDAAESEPVVLPPAVET